MTDWTDALKYALATVAGVAIGLWAGLPPTVQLLLVLMLADIATGFAAGYITRSLSSDISLRGIVKKGVMLIVVGVAAAVEANVGVPLGASVAGFLAMSEGLSLVENVTRCGVPVPQALRAALAKLAPEAPQPLERPTAADLIRPQNRMPRGE